MMSGSESSRQRRPRDVPADAAAWITQSFHETLRQAQRYTLTTVAEKLAAQSSAQRENLNNLEVEYIATQTDVKAARERDRLYALEGVLIQAWQKYISARIDKVTLPLKQEIFTVTGSSMLSVRKFSSLRRLAPIRYLLPRVDRQRKPQTLKLETLQLPLEL